MAQQNTQLRKQTFDNQALGDHARDVQAAFDQMPRKIDRVVEAFYTEPFALGAPVTGVEPAGIKLLRIVSVIRPESPVLCGELVHFVWKPLSNGCVVTSIDGLSPSTTIKYRMTFEFTYPAKAKAGA